MRAHAQKSNPSRPQTAAPLARPTAPQNMLQQRPAIPTSAPAGFDFSRIPMRSGITPIKLRPRLKVGETGDALEQEADRVAERVMRMPEPHGSPTRPAGTSGPAATLGQIETKSKQRGGIGGNTAPPIVHDVLNSPGQPLEGATRAFMELRFGYDFRQVRVHNDDRSAASARAINAEAYTAGTHTAFAAGRYAPDLPAGRRLLAHELAHVVQQSGGGAQVVRRYEAGEHTQFGQTGSELNGLINAPQAIYTVGKNETPEFIAKAFNVSVEDLLERNKSKVKMFPVKGKPKKLAAGFKEGEKIEMPPVLNDAMKDALKQN